VHFPHYPASQPTSQPKAALLCLCLSPHPIPLLTPSPSSPPRPAPSWLIAINRFAPSALFSAAADCGRISFSHPPSCHLCQRLLRDNSASRFTLQLSHGEVSLSSPVLLSLILLLLIEPFLPRPATLDSPSDWPLASTCPSDSQPTWARLQMASC
jgi:hypothetical protein